MCDFNIGDVVYLKSDLPRSHPMTVVALDFEGKAEVAYFAGYELVVSDICVQALVKECSANCCDGCDGIPDGEIPF